VNNSTNSPEDGPVSPKHVETRQYTNKIVTSVGFHSISNLLLLQLLILRQLFVSGAVTYGADMGGRAVEGVGLRPLARRELRVQILPGAWMFLVSVVHCQVEVSVTDRFLVRRLPTGCGMSECDRGTSKRIPSLTSSVQP